MRIDAPAVFILSVVVLGACARSFPSCPHRDGRDLGEIVFDEKLTAFEPADVSHVARLALERYPGSEIARMDWFETHPCDIPGISVEFRPHYRSGRILRYRVMLYSEGPEKGMWFSYGDDAYLLARVLPADGTRFSMPDAAGKGIVGFVLGTPGLSDRALATMMNFMRPKLRPGEHVTAIGRSEEGVKVTTTGPEEFRGRYFHVTGDDGSWKIVKTGDWLS